MSLLSALYTGVSGLQAFGDSLQVIGDNIANVDTTGFKSSSAEFSDMLSQTINSSSGNSQIGRGVSLSNISESFAQGSLSTTDRLTDMAVSGNGFFVVNNGTSDFYTRNGEFTMNSDGDLVTDTGMAVQGYQYDAKGNPLGTIGNIQISDSTISPQVTGSGVPSGSGVSMSVNLDSSAPIQTFDVNNAAATSDFSTSITVYDSLGNGHNMSVYFNKTADNTWQWHGVVDGGDLQGGTAGTPVEGASGTLTFDSTGALQDATTTASSFNFTGTAQTIGFNWGDPVSSGGTGLNGSTQFSSPAVVNSQSQDGFAAGSLTSITVDPSGVISGVYSNGSTIPVAQIALANFANPQGLNKAGSGIYTPTADSGVPVVGKPNVGGFGTISDFSLELSNVDLASEFVNLIATQNDYEANSKIITVGNELMSEVVQLIH